MKKILIETHEKKEKEQKPSFFTKLLKKIESSNDKNFGSKRLDCCNLQKKDKE